MRDAATSGDPGDKDTQSPAPSTPMSHRTLETMARGIAPGGEARPFRPHLEAMRVAGWFLMVSAVWIVFSDRVAIAIAPAPESQIVVQTVKGLAFVTVTAGLIGFLVYRLVLRLEARRRLLSTAVGALSGVVHVVDDVVFTTDAEGRLTGLYGRALALLEIDGPDRLGEPVANVLPVEGPLLNAAMKTLRDRESNLFEVPWLQGAQRRVVLLRMSPLRDSDGRLLGIVGTCRDVTEQRAAAEERQRQRELMALQAETDALTGLPNRRGLQREVSSRFQSGPDATRALVLIDIDHFKVINSSRGHQGGDKVLRQVTRVLRETSPDGAFIARAGSDEFVVVLEDHSLKEAEAWVHALQAALREVTDAPSGELRVSAGIAPLRAGSMLLPALALAESALFASREQGPGRCVAFDSPEAAQRVLRQADEWGPRIRNALRDQGFVLHLQPVFALGPAADNVMAYEVLLRMVDAEGNPIAPGLFMPTAERFGWMPDIDAWVFGEAVTLLRAHPDLRLFVNLSVHGLSSADLRDQVDRLIDQTPGIATRLTFEITESAALTDDDLTLEWMEALRERGCHFALDDFGKGFSTFDYLRRLPADIVKLDGQFSRDLVEDPSERAIVEAMVRVCHCLGKKVVAEMVETVEAELLLRSMGVDMAQGWRWDRARPATEAIARHGLPNADFVGNPTPRLAPDRDGRHHDGPTTPA